jgi:hypothetical protein
MVVNDFDLENASGPHEADAPLFVDADAPLIRPVASQSFQPVAGRREQVFQLTVLCQLSP